MVNEAWGTKRTCPKCGTRFYDLGKETPCVCIECDIEWTPEPILKAKQQIIAAPPPPKEKEKKEEEKPEESEDDELKGLDIGDDIEVEDKAEDDSALDNVSIEEDETDVSDVIDTAAASKND